MSFGAPYVLPLDDGTTHAVFTFPLLKMRQVAELQAAMTAERIAILRKNLDEAKVPASERAQRLAAVEINTINIFELRNWAETPAGSLKVLAKSLGKTEDETDIYLLGLDPVQVAEAALRVTGWVPPVVAPTTKEEKPNP